VDDLWNQPHNVALLKKRMGQTANIYDFNLNMQLPLPITFKTRNNTGDSDANNEMAALAGSLVYYHKPKKSGSDNWQEPPSFWNPFWRAKLHPVTLGGMAAAYVGHPSSGLAAGVTLGKGVNY